MQQFDTNMQKNNLQFLQGAIIYTLYVHGMNTYVVTLVCYVKVNFTACEQEFILSVHRL